ncbi:MAG: hypothetical protein ABUL72_03415, partial [Armatimonadota bacterium]
MTRRLTALFVVFGASVAVGVAVFNQQRLGDRSPKTGHQLLPDAGIIGPVGAEVSFGGRPVDVASSPSGQWVAVKDEQGVRLFDRRMKPLGQWVSKDGTSPCGLLFGSDDVVWVTTSNRFLTKLSIAPSGALTEATKIDLGDTMPCGFALDSSHKLAYVALS